MLSLFVVSFFFCFQLSNFPLICCFLSLGKCLVLSNGKPWGVQKVWWICLSWSLEVQLSQLQLPCWKGKEHFIGSLQTTRGLCKSWGAVGIFYWGLFVDNHVLLLQVRCKLIQLKKECHPLHTNEKDEHWTAVVNGFKHCQNHNPIYWDLIRSRAMHKLEAANLC